MGTTAALSPLFRLVSLIVVIPALLTYAHLRYSLSSNAICFVGPVEQDAILLSPSRRRRAGSASTSLSSVESKQDATSSTSDAARRHIDDVDLSLVYGIYMARPHPDSKRTFNLLYGPTLRTWWWIAGWPSVVSVASTIAVPTSDILRTHRRPRSAERIANVAIAYSDAEGWCIQKADGQHLVDGARICYDGDSDEKPNKKGVTLHAYPPSGTWTVEGSDDTASRQHIRVSCPSTSMLDTVQNSKNGESSAPGAPLLGSIRRNPNKRRTSRPNQTMQQILHRPTTTFLLCLNIYLAYRYWNSRTPPSSLAKVYSKIVLDYDLWRSFTGATAHFEPLHLGFNMMSLYSLGMELEEGYGSINFLFYNISLIALTTAVMMALIWLRIRYTSDTSLTETSSVGYSGVLFAWMVVASLERHRTCPVPFIQGLCFDTYSLFGGRLKVSAGPIVQLGVAQFIMPRVSFTGHLAGIICGFFLHWNLLPLGLFCPQVLIPACFLAHLKYVRKVIPINGSSFDTEEALNSAGGKQIEGEFSSYDSGTASNNNTFRSVRAQKQHRLLLLTKRSMIVVAGASFLFHSSNMFLSQAVALVFFALSVQSNALLLCHRQNSNQSIEDKGKITTEMSRGGILWRGSVITLVLTIVSDAMTVSAWLVTSVNVSSERRLLVGLWPALAILLFRILASIAGLCLSAGMLHDLVEVGGGVFVTIFGPVLRCGKDVADVLSRSSSLTASEGRGIALGDYADNTTHSS
mmetsp:Transcript_6098/g.13302  ORF Transcript_6098/g.13302 Transcript_6098/m.13302 type:complete len:746 (-) Transcript_6098:113-2350(-)|eukprot:CAMPEP_0178475660 /NCGR_PEP_ID=MMETSP0696-20121128/3230_1 /TAXON_ID=265572 /ORGANISM="Extubocellulus spinifer, Strain CCMP396" /LENGTH=745 /DNA_ID=CAMNT_0020102947 /DNA_START=55 /DNA_END=2292 /DNA_ORIENTATION=-